MLPRSWVAVVAGEASSQVVGFPDVDPCALTFRTLGQDQPVEPGHILQWGERRLVAAIKCNGAPVEPLQAGPHIDRFVDGAPVSGRCARRDGQCRSRARSTRVAATPLATLFERNVVLLAGIRDDTLVPRLRRSR